VRLLSDNGTDLTLTVGDRPVLVDDGVMSDDDVEQGDTAVNLPAGEVFVAPVETSVHGRVVIDFAYRNGQTMRGLELTVEQGRVTLQGTAQGGCAFREVLAMGHGHGPVMGQAQMDGRDPLLLRQAPGSALQAHHRLAGRAMRNLDVAPTDRAPAAAQGFHDRLFGGKTGGKALGPVPAGHAPLQLRGGKNALEEAGPGPRQGPLHPCHLHHIDTDADDHPGHHSRATEAYSTVTLLARLRGLSTSRPKRRATW